MEYSDHSRQMDKGALGTGKKLAEDLKNMKNNSAWTLPDRCSGYSRRRPRDIFAVKSLGWPSKSHQDYAKPMRVDVAVLGVGAASELGLRLLRNHSGLSSTLAWIKLKDVLIQRKAKFLSL